MFVKLDDRLGQIEIDGAAPLPLAVQNHRQLAHQLKSRHQRRIMLARAASPSRTALTLV